MITYLNKDLTTIERGMIVHGCNAQGVMGSGVALALRTKWPQIFQGYRNLCESYSFGIELLGCVQFVSISSIFDKEIIVGNLITQHEYGRDGKRYADVNAIEKALSTACQHVSLYKLPLYMPKIGCGLGGLNWGDDVHLIVERLSAVYNVDIFVCDNKQENWK